MRVSVLGCGRWGSFITWYLNALGLEVAEWGREGSPSFEVLKNTGENEYVKLSDGVRLTSDLKEAVDFAEVIIISIKSQALREFGKKIKALGGDKKPVVLCMKGLEEGTGKRLSEIMIENGFDKNNIAVWVGPGHIQEFTDGKPNCMVIDGYDRTLINRLIEAFKSNLIRFYYGEDVIGSEVGAAAKNVMGIAAGVLDGGGFKSLKGALMARGAREVARLIKAMGGNELSAYGLCHLGDYETTLFSEYSHNRKFGEQLYKGIRFEKLAEGVSTAKAMTVLAEKYGVELPITQAVYNIVYRKHDPLKELLTLFDRRTVTEFE